MSIEFIGILPFYFLFFLLLWQVVASGYAVLSLKSAANDGAQVYALTESYNDAVDAVNKSIGDSSLLTNPLVTVTSDGGDGLFDLKISARHPLVFIPEKWKSTMSVAIDSKAAGKVMLK
ncbi:pilus assembly protein [Sporosarcina luteola]|uniref:pilus assembly protein n=1 Tax=Sporosarcina luteola TaxID=582850 RepID=UPI002041FAD0|nr:pilus assembly protein [Sporosarcina luteola]MCM3708960.1 pilus assembly protein [Sporosarcina luteola]